VTGFFTSSLGVRGDIRYFRGFEDELSDEDADDAAEFIGSQVLSQLEFWRATIGVAFRW
jgi:hypothetical protein